jgi:hypothetical protein
MDIIVAGKSTATSGWLIQNENQKNKVLRPSLGRVAVLLFNLNRYGVSEDM